MNLKSAPRYIKNNIMDIIQDKGKQVFTYTTEGFTCRVNYTITGDIFDIRSTFVPDQLRGKGIAAQLVKAACDYARKNGLKIKPTCSYADLWLKRHKGYNVVESDEHNDPNSCLI